MMKDQGWCEKYFVRRVDGQDTSVGYKHFGCTYFVLDLSHDPHAIPAVVAYADSCAEDKPMLAGDIICKILERSSTTTIPHIIRITRGVVGFCAQLGNHQSGVTGFGDDIPEALHSLADRITRQHESNSGYRTP